MEYSDPPNFVLDTHTLFWYFEYPHLLSPAADAVFRLAAVGEARIIVPAIVVAEFYHLTQKVGAPVLPSALLSNINSSREFIFSELGQGQLEKMEEFAGVTEMHDRLIVAEALVYKAPIVTSDAVLRGSGAVEVIW